MNTNARRRSELALVFVLVLTVCGCMVGPNYIPPQTPSPPEWSGIDKTLVKEPPVASVSGPDLTQWWRQLNDPILTTLVEEAVKSNLDLKNAVARLRQARAARGIASGALWPSINSSGGYQWGQKAGVSGEQNLFQAGLDSVWELDFFGGKRRAIESADASIEAAIEAMRAVQVSLVAEVALNYIQLRSYQQEILIAQSNLKAQQRTAEITHKRYDVGFASALDVANADSIVAVTDAQIPVYEIAERQSIYALSVLLALPPADLLKKLAPRGNLPGVPTEVPSGLPSDLLRRRPDIRESEAQLHAATAQIGAAIADYFPAFSLTGAVNWNSNLLQNWWSGSSRSFGIGPSVNWQIFQGGAIESNVHVQESLRDQAFIAYQKTVLAAFQDVENALIAFNKEQQHRKALDSAVVANRKAVDLSLQLYSEGQTDFLNVATAQRSLYVTEDALVQSCRNVATDFIALYKALGGGGEPLPSRVPEKKAVIPDNTPGKPVL